MLGHVTVTDLNTCSEGNADESEKFLGNSVTYIFEKDARQVVSKFVAMNPHGIV